MTRKSTVYLVIVTSYKQGYWDTANLNHHISLIKF